MHFKAGFDDVFINPIRIDLSKLGWVTKLISDTQFQIQFAYPIENPPQCGDFVYICNGGVSIFTGYVIDVQEKYLTLSNARYSPKE